MDQDLLKTKKNVTDFMETRYGEINIDKLEKTMYETLESAEQMNTGHYAIHKTKKTRKLVIERDVIDFTQQKESLLRNMNLSEEDTELKAKQEALRQRDAKEEKERLQKEQMDQMNLKAGILIHGTADGQPAPTLAPVKLSYKERQAQKKQEAERLKCNPAAHIDSPKLKEKLAQRNSQADFSFTQATAQMETKVSPEQYKLTKAFLKGADSPEAIKKLSRSKRSDAQAASEQNVQADKAMLEGLYSGDIQAKEATMVGMMKTVMSIKLLPEMLTESYALYNGAALRHLSEQLHSMKQMMGKAEHKEVFDRIRNSGQMDMEQFDKLMQVAEPFAYATAYQINALGVNANGNQDLGGYTTAEMMKKTQDKVVDLQIKGQNALKSYLGG